jgi:hypothetical protein
MYFQKPFVYAGFKGVVIAYFSKQQNQEKRKWLSVSRLRE